MTPLTTLKDITAALKQCPVFCDIAQPSAIGIPVRNIRRFKAEGLEGTVTLNTTEWTSRYHRASRSAMRF